MNYWVIFLTGLTTGGLSCLALQGGLLASAIVEDGENNTKSKVNRIRTIIIFLATKLIAYTLLGLFLGLIGRFIGLSPKATGILNIFIALFMLGVAGEALNIHPLFRYFLIQPPKFVRKFTKEKDQKGDFAAALLGFITVLVPCGVTQAMMAYAIGSANFASGALIMFTFVLGTIPVFFALSYLATSFGAKYHLIFRKIIAILLIVLAGYTLFNASRLLGFSFNSEKSAKTKQTENVSQQSSTGETQKVTIKLNDSTGYTPSTVRIKKGRPVEVTLTNDGARGCIRSFVIPNINKRVTVPASGSTSFTFTPSKAGTLTFTCSMGMYQGQFIVE